MNVKVDVFSILNIQRIQRRRWRWNNSQEEVELPKSAIVGGGTPLRGERAVQRIDASARGENRSKFESGNQPGLDFNYQLETAETPEIMAAGNTGSLPSAIPLGSCIGGVPIRLHLSFFLLLAIEFFNSIRYRQVK